MRRERPTSASRRHHAALAHPPWVITKDVKEIAKQLQHNKLGASQIIALCTVAPKWK